MLRPNDAVAVVAPSGPFERAAFERGLAVIANRYRPVFTPRLFDTWRYLAGTPEARTEEFQRALDDDDIKAIFTARGGYGAMQLLPALRWSTPKPIIGFSDVTALHLAARTHDWRTLHGPVLTQLGTQPADVAARLFDALEGRPLAPLSGTRTVVSGVAEGPLVGGNLSVLTRLLGTPWMPSLAGAVLLIEDVGERPYRVDRMWTHLRLTGALTGVAAIAFGDFTGCEEKGAPYTCADVIDPLARHLGVPCLAGLPIGHGALNQPVPLGARVRLDADARSLTFLEGLWP